MVKKKSMPTSIAQSPPSGGSVDRVVLDTVVFVRLDESAQLRSANFIVSDDKNLLDLKHASGISIIDTQAFLARLEGSDEK
jgi:hypothetical protein